MRRSLKHKREFLLAFYWPDPKFPGRYVRMIYCSEEARNGKKKKGVRRKICSQISGTLRAKGGRRKGSGEKFVTCERGKKKGVRRKICSYSRIQERFNPEPFIVKKEKTAFKRRDKVMQLRNNYEKMIFNGEQGIIWEFKPGEKKLKVNFDGNMVEYHTSELDELTLSYAVSVHKAQGSEYDMLVLVLLPSHFIMLNRELFYTAVTRAKRKIFLISDEVTIQQAIDNASPSERKTLLPRPLAEVFAGKNIF